jgi:hypothetical protein
MAMGDVYVVYVERCMCGRTGTGVRLGIGIEDHEQDVRDISQRTMGGVEASI